ncbi:MAG: helix-turn-helix domain-containing protein [Candidatus Aminicenantes bacterium]|nr:helix-turn-helix domain-containing protein [Candidatus Aminicenantes bacterium]
MNARFPEKLSARHLILLILTAVVFSLHLLALDPDRPVHEYRLDKWETGDGLPTNAINALAQTPEGFLWIGTPKGLLRFDGLEFAVVHFETGSAKDYNIIYYLYVDKEGILWIGSDSGLTRYKNNRFKTFSPPNNLPQKDTRFIHEDMHGNLWLAAGRGNLLRYKAGGFTLFDESKGFTGRRISAIFEDSKGVLWIAASRDGLYRYRDGIFSKYEIKEFTDSYSVYTVYEDRKGDFWIGTNRGLIYDTGESASFTDMPSGSVERRSIVNSTKVLRGGQGDLERGQPSRGVLVGRKAYRSIEVFGGVGTFFQKGSDSPKARSTSIYKILEDSEGNIWCGGGDGLARLSRGRAGDMAVENSLKGEQVTCILEDREKSLWVGTAASGLKRLKESTFTTYAKEANLPAGSLSIYKDAAGRIWAGTNRGLLYKYRDGMFLEVFRVDPLPMEEAAITGISGDKKDRLWLGAAQLGVFVFNPDSKEKPDVYSTKNGLNSDEVQALLCDSRGNTWVGTYDRGIAIFSRGVFSSYTTKDGLTGKSVFNIHEDRNFNIWIATSNGLQFLKNGNPRERISYLPGVIVTAIYEDKNGVFWFGTYFQGLKRFKQGKFFTYTREDGLGSDYIYQIDTDGRENFWFSSFDGIFRVSKRELDEFAAGNRSKLDCISFGLTDGIESEENTFSTKNSLLKTPAGELWFATQKGIAAVDPGIIRINKYPPPVIITKILFNSLPIERDRESPPSKGGLEECEFYFTVPTFISPEKVKIKYKLEGIDEEWREPSPTNSRSVKYKKLTAGQYRFRVIAANSSGIWNEKGAAFDFIIEPYFLQTFYFKALLVLIFIVVVLGVYYLIKTGKVSPSGKKDKSSPGKNKYKDSPLEEDKAGEYLKKLDHLLKIEKIYLDENISLQSLAKQIGIPAYLLSQVINEHLGKNFWDLVNSYRIAEARRLLSVDDKDKYSVLEIAYRVGFNTGSAFNRAFKKYTGKTPTQFKTGR